MMDEKAYVRTTSSSTTFTTALRTRTSPAKAIFSCGSSVVEGSPCAR
jgi:hypothetical protein